MSSAGMTVERLLIDLDFFRDREEFAGDVTRFSAICGSQSLRIRISRLWWQAIRNGTMRQSECRKGSRSAPGLLNQVCHIGRACEVPWLRD
jgi:hypothetical protein